MLTVVLIVTELVVVAKATNLMSSLQTCGFTTITWS